VEPLMNRKDFLKMYIATLVNDGKISLTSPTEMISKVGAMIAIDIPEVLTEMGMFLAEQAGHKATAFFWGKANEIARKVSRMGWRDVWKEMQATYAKGSEENVARSRRR
jgi:hypothetical protein